MDRGIEHFERLSREAQANGETFWAQSMKMSAEQHRRTKARLQDLLDGKD